MGVSARPRHWAGSLIKTKREPSARRRGGSRTTHCNWYTSFVFDLILLWLLSPSARLSVAAGAHTRYCSASVIESQRIMTPVQVRSHTTRTRVWYQFSKKALVHLLIVILYTVSRSKDERSCWLLICKMLFLLSTNTSILTDEYAKKTSALLKEKSDNDAQRLIKMAVWGSTTDTV